MYVYIYLFVTTSMTTTSADSDIDATLETETGDVEFLDTLCLNYNGTLKYPNEIRIF